MSNSLVKYKDLALKVIYYTKRRTLGTKIFFATSKFQEVLLYFEHNLKDPQTFLKSSYFLNGKQIFPNDILLYFCTVDPNLRLVEEDLYVEIEELEHIDDSSEPIYEKLLKPLINPFKLIILNINEGILQMVDFPKDKIHEYGFDTITNNNFACCNSPEALYISYQKNFWIISNKNFAIEKKEMPIAKEKHSMGYILSNNTIFIVGGDNTDSFYYDINTKEFITWGKMSGIQDKPALIQYGDFLYSFNSYSPSGIYFERTKLTSPAKKWEKLVPQSGDQESGFFYNILYGVSKCSGGNILFAGGVNNQLRTFIYNLKLNVLYINTNKDESVLLSERCFYKIDHNFNIGITQNIEKNHIIAIINKNSKSLNLLPFEKIGSKTRNTLLQYDNPRNRLPGNLVIQCRYMSIKDYEIFLKQKEEQKNQKLNDKGKKEPKKIGIGDDNEFKFQIRNKTPFSLERISEMKSEEENDEDEFSRNRSSSAKKEKRKSEFGLDDNDIKHKLLFQTYEKNEDKNKDKNKNTNSSQKDKKNKENEENNKDENDKNFHSAQKQDETDNKNINLSEEKQNLNINEDKKEENKEDKKEDKNEDNKEKKNEDNKEDNNEEKKEDNKEDNNEEKNEEIKEENNKNGMDNNNQMSKSHKIIEVKEENFNIDSKKSIKSQNINKDEDKIEKSENNEKKNININLNNNFNNTKKEEVNIIINKNDNKIDEKDKLVKININSKGNQTQKNNISRNISQASNNNNNINNADIFNSAQNNKNVNIRINSTNNSEKKKIENIQRVNNNNNITQKNVQAQNIQIKKTIVSSTTSSTQQENINKTPFIDNNKYQNILEKESVYLKGKSESERNLHKINNINNSNTKTTSSVQQKKMNDIKPISTSLEENIGLTEPNQNNNARKDIKIISHRSINTSKGKIKNNENNSKLVKTNSFKVKINLDHKKTDSNNQSQRTKININNRNSNNCVTDINNKTAKNDINNVKSHVITSTYHSNNINNNVTYNNNGIKITRTTNTKANIINTNEINKDGKRYITKNVQRIRKEDNGQK